MMTAVWPGLGRCRMWAVIVPRTIGRPARSTDQPPGQSTAAHKVGSSTSSGMVQVHAVMGWPDSAMALVGAGVSRIATGSVRSSPQT